MIRFLLALWRLDCGTDAGWSTLAEPTPEELAEAAKWRRENFPGIREDPLPPMSYNDAMEAIGGKTVGDITQEEAEPIIIEMMRKHLQVPEGEQLVFTEEDFAAAINAMPIEEYARKRAAIAAYRLP